MTILLSDFAGSTLDQTAVDARITALAPGLAVAYLRTKAVDTGNIADDGVFELTFGGDVSAGIVAVSDNGNNTRGIFGFRARNSPFITAISASGFQTSTNDLTVTPGTDGQVTVSATDTNKFQINNRSGGARQYTVWVATGESGRLT